MTPDPTQAAPSTPAPETQEPAEGAAAGDLVEKLRTPIPDTYACQQCGRRDGLDAVAPNAIWEKLSAHYGGKNLLCLWCMDRAARELGITCSISLHFAGHALHGTSQSDADRDHVNRLVERAERAEAQLAKVAAVVDGRMHALAASLASGFYANEIAAERRAMVAAIREASDAR